MLLGLPGTITVGTRGISNERARNYFGYFQDDYTVTPRLTLNLGLRWDVQAPPTDPLNRFVNYVPGQKSTVNAIAPTGLLFYGDAGVERGGIPVSYAQADDLQNRAKELLSPRGSIAVDDRTNVLVKIGRAHV